MGQRKNIITLISCENAKKGYKFIFEGKTFKECKSCPLFKVCVENLERGRVYEVVDVRSKKHKCKALNTDLAVVEVKEADIEAAIPTSIAVEGALITYRGVDCSEVSCRNYGLCNPLGLKIGDKCKIIKVYGKISCPKGKALTKVLLSRFL